MKTKQALTILREFQRWRKGIEPYNEAGAKIPYSPSEIGLALDVAIRILSRMPEFVAASDSLALAILDKTPTLNINNRAKLLSNLVKPWKDEEM